MEEAFEISAWSPRTVIADKKKKKNMNSQLVFLMVLMVTMALIQGTWSAPYPQLFDFGNFLRSLENVAFPWLTPTGK
uniref:Uncharacterized protein n=1 Tax=Timema genevievae TaxID=629358 RepID=A0A7R9JSM2_TIMGE|nr:unnamed protein product [Timema genevievae]